LAPHAFKMLVGDARGLASAEPAGSHAPLRPHYRAAAIAGAWPSGRGRTSDGRPQQPNRRSRFCLLTEARAEPESTRGRHREQDRGFRPARAYRGRGLRLRLLSRIFSVPVGKTLPQARPACGGPSCTNLSGNISLYKARYTGTWCEASSALGRRTLAGNATLSREIPCSRPRNSLITGENSLFRCVGNFAASH
jgi:hypothetical protein